VCSFPFAEGYCLCDSSEKLWFRVKFSRVRGLVGARVRVSCRSDVLANIGRYTDSGR